MRVRCLPPDPRQTDRVSDSEAGTGEGVSVSGHRQRGRQTWRIEGARRTKGTQAVSHFQVP